jgi:hypothetical protein
MGRRKFKIGDRVIGNDKTGDFADKKGTIIGYGPHQSEYKVHFDDKGDNYVNSWWIDLLNEKKV